MAFFLPLERLLPRIRARAPLASRALVIGALALLAAATNYALQVYAQHGLVQLFLGMKLFSLAKSALPGWAVFAASFLLLDLLMYALHLTAHNVAWLWRIHAVHHADEHVTAISGLLHHPFENAINFIVVIFVGVILGVPVMVLALYGLTAAAHNIFSHADVALPGRLDAALRWLIVTPDVHRTHHSVRLDEGNSNFGQIFTFWDRLLGTYVDRPCVVESELVMGLPAGEKPRSFRLPDLLKMPFVRRSG